MVLLVLVTPRQVVHLCGNNTGIETKGLNDTAVPFYIYFVQTCGAWNGDSDSESDNDQRKKKRRCTSSIIFTVFIFYYLNLNLLPYLLSTTMKLYFLSQGALCRMPYFFCGLYYSSVETVFAAAAASLNFLHSLRCPPCFQWFTWHSRPQYCTVRHNLQGCKGRNGVLGLPQVEQQRIVGVVRPSYLSNI